MRHVTYVCYHLYIPVESAGNVIACQVTCACDACVSAHCRVLCLLLRSEASLATTTTCAYGLLHPIVANVRLPTAQPHTPQSSLSIGTPVTRQMISFPNQPIS